MTVGTLHETVGCAASFTRFVPFSCCRPGQGPCCLPRRLWPAPACNLTGMARAGPPCSESARAYLVMSYLPDSGATAGPSRPCHYRHSAADRLPSSRPPLRFSESDWLSWLVGYLGRGPTARSPASAGRDSARCRPPAGPSAVATGRASSAPAGHTGAALLPSAGPGRPGSHPSRGAQAAVGLS